MFPRISFQAFEAPQVLIIGLAQPKGPALQIPCDDVEARLEVSRCQQRSKRKIAAGQVIATVVDGYFCCVKLRDLAL